MPKQSSFQVLENEMRDCALCKVHTFEGNKKSGTLTWKYRWSKSPLAGIFDTVLWDANGVSAESETKNVNCNAVFYRTAEAKWMF